MTDTLTQIKEALEKATPGPWRWLSDSVTLFPQGGHDYGDNILMIQKSAEMLEHDQNLIANAPSYISYLIDELEKANSDRENVYAALKDRADSIEFMHLELEKAQSEVELLKIAIHTHESYDRIVCELHEENEQLRVEHTAMRKALEWYAAESTYDIDHLNKHGYIIIDQDGGDKARVTLTALSQLMAEDSLSQPINGPRKTVKWFAERMESRLRENDYKGGWGEQNCSMNFLAEQMDKKCRRYTYNHGSGHTPEHLIDHLADIANYAMMQADRLSPEKDKD